MGRQLGKGRMKMMARPRSRGPESFPTARGRYVALCAENRTIPLPVVVNKKERDPSKPYSLLLPSYGMGDKNAVRDGACCCCYYCHCYL